MYFDIKGNVVFHNRVYTNDYLRKMEKYVIEALGEQKEGNVVALAMNRTPLLLAALFAFLKKGIPFLPIDLSFPQERLAYMLEKADVKTILSDCESVVCGIDTVFLNSEEDVDSKYEILPQEEEHTFISEDEVAYILFTSGTTGLPKAVEVLRRGLKNFIDGIMEAVIFAPDCRIACLTNITFDIFFLETVLALNVGMTVVLADENERNNPRLIQKLLVSNEVNAMQCTPSTMRMLEMIDPQFTFLKGIQTVMLGGEPLPQTMLLTLQQVMTGRIYNMYGPTETTIWSTVSDLTKEKEVNIGKPIKNTHIYIVDDDLKPVQNGDEGEILIAGDGLARGYLQDEEKTAKAFVMLSGVNGTVRVYRTGDFGYKSSTGEYICTGRRDGQVKVLGHRIELGDVEYHIARIPNMGNNVVVADPDDGNRLICFYLSEYEKHGEELRQEALKILPDYMVPCSWIRVPKLIYTASGKTDRKAIFEKYKAVVEKKDNTKKVCVEETNTSDQDSLLHKIMSCFEVVEDEITVDTVFESLGLDSLKYVSYLVNIEELFDIEFEDEMLSLEYFKTFGELVEYIETAVSNK